MFTTITGKLGRHVQTTNHGTEAEAEKAALDAIHSGRADSAAIWTEDPGNVFGNKQVATFGSGR